MRSPRTSHVASTLAATLLLATALAGSGHASATERPGNLERPRLSGTFMDGSVVSTNTGRWRNAPTSFQYRWLQCDRAGARCLEIAGQTGAQYLVRTADVGRRLRSQVTACNGDGCSSAISGAGPVVGAKAPPQNTRAPAVAGSPIAGQTLQADNGDWANGVTDFDHQWQRCDANGANCGNIGGATRTSYRVGSGDVGRRLRVAVTAANNRGRATAASAPTAPAQPPLPGGAIKLPSGETSIPVSSVALPARLIVSAIDFNPNAITSRTGVFESRFRVTDTRGFVVRDALVHVIGVPFNRVAVDAERPTDLNGWATLAYRPLRGLPMVRGATVVFFVRARKPGDDLLAGVSSRRLVSVRVVPG
jgi:hypothetical protein